MESLYKMRVRESEQLKNVLALCQDIEQKNMPPSFQRLKTIVKKLLDQNVSARNFEARNERTVTGTAAESRSKGKSVNVERKQGDCF